MVRCMLFLLLLPLLAQADEGAVRVTVVVILASEQHTEIGEKVKNVAVEVQKTNANLTGFRLSKTLSESIPRGGSYTFKLPGDGKLEVSVHAQAESKGCTTLTIKPPTLGEITYNCKCDRYFPVVTNFQPNRDSDEKMILAVMAKPCIGGK